MWSLTQLCRCGPALRVMPGRLVAPCRTGFETGTGSVTRQLITTAQDSNKGFHSIKGLRLSHVLKSSGLVARLCSTAPKPRTSKTVGYWLLGCSGMVFSAVVLGMVIGYLLLLYTIYYVVNLAIASTNGSK